MQYVRRTIARIESHAILVSANAARGYYFNHAYIITVELLIADTSGTALKFKVSVFN